MLGWLSDTRGLSVHVSVSLLISGVFVALMGIASTYSMIMLFAVLAALGTIPIPIAGAVLLMIVIPYPWKSLNRHFNRISAR